MKKNKKALLTIQKRLFYCKIISSSNLITDSTRAEDFFQRGVQVFRQNRPVVGQPFRTSRARRLVTLNMCSISATTFISGSSSYPNTSGNSDSSAFFLYRHNLVLIAMHAFPGKQCMLTYSSLDFHTSFLTVDGHLLSLLIDEEFSFPVRLRRRLLYGP